MFLLRNISKTIFFTFIFVVSNAAFASDDCQYFQNYLSKGTSKSGPALSVLNNAIKPRTKLVIFADTHDDEIMQAAYPSLIGGIVEANKEFDCFFEELPSSAQKAIDDYSKGKSSFDD